MSTPEKYRSSLRRALGLGLGVVLATGASLAMAAPAHAEDEIELPPAPVIHSVSGYVGIDGGEWEDNYSSKVHVELVELSLETTTSGDQQDWGQFSFADVPDGDYTLEFVSEDANAPTETKTVEVAITADDPTAYELDDTVLLSPLPAIEVSDVSASVSGKPIVGSTLTGGSTGWPAGTAVTYEWGYSTGQSGGGIEGATSSSLDVTDDLVGYQLSFIATGALEGYTPTSVSAVLDDAVTQVKKPAADAPAANSGDLETFLSSKGSTPAAAGTVGLPSGGLSPEKDYTANVPWTEAVDSYVDVYLYSTPTFLGTFPVVGGVVQINLSASVLASLQGGSHTLVAVGQTSGGVQSVALTLTPMLASTGFDPALPLGIATVLLLRGAALLVARRRMARVRSAH